MAEIKILSPSEQVAAHLREELLRGRWIGTMPGEPRLVAELGVDGKTVCAALGLLETEGLLLAQGTGRPRKIVVPENLLTPVLRVAILHYEPLDRTEDWIFTLQKKLTSRGYNCFFAEKSLIELGADVRRITRLVKRTHADAWIVISGSRDVLEWFAKQETPTFALFGRRGQLPIAGVGPDHVAALRAAVRRLVALGHQRIVMLVRENVRAGGAGGVERGLIKEMKAHGLPTSRYNVPHWEDTAEGFHRVLEELFRISPPTALIIFEPFLFHAAKDHLAQRGILAPKHVSLICSDPDPSFAWCVPSIAHNHWKTQPVVRRVARWVDNIARGKDDLKQTLTKAEFVDGGTVGKAR